MENLSGILRVIDVYKVTVNFLVSVKLMQKVPASRIPICHYLSYYYTINNFEKLIEE